MFSKTCLTILALTLLSTLGYVALVVLEACLCYRGGVVSVAEKT